MDFETTFKENRQVLLNLARAHSLKCGNMILRFCDKMMLEAARQRKADFLKRKEEKCQN